MFNTLALANVAENLKKYGGNVTLSGILIVFSMLILLVVIIWAFGSIMSNINKSKSAKKMPTKKNDVNVKPIVQSVVPSNESDEGIIAAISAAVMMMYDGTGVKPVIRSIKPASVGVRTTWKQAGVMNNTRSF